MNFTGGRKQTLTVIQLPCALMRDWNAWALFCLLMQFLAILWSLLAFARCLAFIHSPNLFFNALLRDLYVGLITEPLSVVYWMSLAHEQRNLSHYPYASTVIARYTLCKFICLQCRSAIGVYRPLALLLGLRYRRIVAIFWITSLKVTL